MEDLKNKTIGERIRYLRGNQTQKELAEAVHVSVSAIGMFEQDRRVPRDETKKEIADYFGLLVDDIFF